MDFSLLNVVFLLIVDDYDVIMCYMLMLFLARRLAGAKIFITWLDRF